RALDFAQKERDTAEDLAYAAQMSQAHRAHNDDNIMLAQTLMNKYGPESNNRGRRDFAWRLLWRMCRDQAQFAFQKRTLPLSNTEAEVNSVAYSPDGKLMAAGGSDNLIQLIDAAHRIVLAKIPAHKGGCFVRFSPDGKLVASIGTRDGKIILWQIISSRSLAP